MHLTAADYAVIVTILVIPLAIGFFYAWKDSNKDSRDEYLLGGRRMGLLPVTLSIFVTFQSAISFIGVTSDHYIYGPMMVVIYIGIALGCLSSYFTMVPLMYPLQLRSIYDYLEMRYQSLALRKLTTVIGMLQVFFYLVVAMLVPGLTLQAAAGIPFWVSVAVVGGIGIFYTAIGGIKSVIWADVFQAVVMVVGVLVPIVKGAVDVGGMDQVWSRAEHGGRTSFTTVSLDPRTRHSWWGMTIGAMILWQSNVYAQSNLQRIHAMKSQQLAKLSALVSVAVYLVYGLILGLLGLVVYAYFDAIRCDPLQEGLISNVNQISLYFVLLVFEDYPGLSGLCMATIFSGSLSSLSSGTNALAANTVEDILGGWLNGVSERTVIVIAKILVFVYGFAVVGVAYLAKSMQGPVTKAVISAIGAFGSVAVGIFLMGCTVPWANKYGALVGAVLTLALNMWMGLGGLWYGVRTRPLPSPSSDQCYLLTNGHYFDNTTSLNLTDTNLSLIDTNDQYEYGFFLYDISYEWYGAIGTIVCSICILVVSKLTSSWIETKTDARLIFPMLREYWQLYNQPESDDNQLELAY